MLCRVYLTYHYFVNYVFQYALSNVHFVTELLWNFRDTVEAGTINVQFKLVQIFTVSSYFLFKIIFYFSETSTTFLRNRLSHPRCDQNALETVLRAF